MENKLMVYKDSHGFGILGRVIDVMSPCLVYSSFFRIFLIKSSWWLSRFVNYFVVLLVCVVGILSGSKSSLINIVFIFSYLLMFFFSDPDIFCLKGVRRFFNLFLCLAVFSVVFVFLFPVVRYGFQGFLYAVGQFYNRLAISGDIYVFAYPGNAVDYIPRPGSGVAYLFNDFFGLNKILPNDKVYEPLGKILFEYSSGVYISAGGANARHNIFGYKCFGVVGGLLFSFLIGLISSFFRNKLPRLLKANALNGLLFTEFSFFAVNIELDPVYIIGQISNVIFIFIPFVLFVYLLMFPIIKGR
ncbi:MAG: hypothetical protein JW739_00770 [Opitutales bacterium]|nr:hypothetical protein [Opitutales bacterium]